VVPNLLPVDAVEPPGFDALFRIHVFEPTARFILVPPLQRVAVRGKKRWREKRTQRFVQKALSSKCNRTSILKPLFSKNLDEIYEKVF
jgi:hypothetical protein